MASTLLTFSTGLKRDICSSFKGMSGVMAPVKIIPMMTKEEISINTTMGAVVTVVKNFMPTLEIVESNFCDRVDRLGVDNTLKQVLKSGESYRTFYDQAFLNMARGSGYNIGMYIGSIVEIICGIMIDTGKYDQISCDFDIWTKSSDPACEWNKIAFDSTKNRGLVIGTQLEGITSFTSFVPIHVTSTYASSTYTDTKLDCSRTHCICVPFRRKEDGVIIVVYFDLCSTAGTAFFTTDSCSIDESQFINRENPGIATCEIKETNTIIPIAISTIPCIITAKDYDPFEVEKVEKVETVAEYTDTLSKT